MVGELRKLGRQTAIYGLGDLLGRLGGFLLLPVYTRCFTTEQYGALELLFMTGSVLSLLLGRQISSATLRFYFEYESLSDRNRVISTSLILYTAFAGSLLGILSLFSEQFSQAIFSKPDYTKHFLVLFAFIYFSLSEEILLSYVRAIEKAFLFVAITLSGLVAKMVLCIYLVAFEHWGIMGVLVGNSAGTALVWILLCLYVIRRVGIGLDLGKFREIVKYGLPLMVTGISGVVIGNLGRFFLNWYISLGAVGVYALAMRLASILGFLVVHPFTKAYGPFRFGAMKRADAKEIYARVATYFTVVCVWATVAIIALCGEVLQIMARESYWAARSVVPLLLLSNLLGSCLYYMFQIGVYLQKKTRVLTWLFAGAAVLDIAMMTILVPRYGVYGAAASQVIAHGLIAFVGLHLSQRVYPIQYEWDRLIKIGVVGAVASFALYFQYHPNPYFSASIKVPIVMLFPVCLRIAGFFNRGELAAVSSVWQRVRTQVAAVRN